jgi:hypothetical protein
VEKESEVTISMAIEMSFQARKSKEWYKTFPINFS